MARDSSRLIDPPAARRAFTLFELVVSIVVIAVVLAVLLPTLSSARVASRRERCAHNQWTLAGCWEQCQADHDDCLPFVADQPGWRYGGVRFSRVTGSFSIDYDRPLNRYLPVGRPGAGSAPEDAGGGGNAGARAGLVFSCPSDEGISSPDVPLGTGERTAFRSFGTSYRANAALLDARLAGVADEARGLARGEITTPPSRLVLMGDAAWYEAAEATGRNADWHGVHSAGNILFLDGSVRFMAIRPRSDRNQAAVFDPVMAGTALATSDALPTDAPPAKLGPAAD